MRDGDVRRGQRSPGLASGAPHDVADAQTDARRDRGPVHGRDPAVVCRARRIDQATVQAATGCATRARPKRRSGFRQTLLGRRLPAQSAISFAEVGAFAGESGGGVVEPPRVIDELADCVGRGERATWSTTLKDAVHAVIGAGADAEGFVGPHNGGGRPLPSSVDTYPEGFPIGELGTPDARLSRAAGQP